MTEKIPSVGDRIDARCTKCRKNMNHTIVAMVDLQPVRVKCNTCDGEHNYKNPSLTKKTKTPTTAVKKTARVTKSKTDPREAERREWEKLSLKMDSSNAVDYEMDGQYHVDSLLKHPVFGIGVVQQICGSRKILVLFQDGNKLLRCA